MITSLPKFLLILKFGVEIPVGKNLVVLLNPVRSGANLPQINCQNTRPRRYLKFAALFVL